MPSGGKRVGAGRKPGSSLDFDQRVWIGAECRDRYQRLALAFRNERIEELSRKYEAMRFVEEKQAFLQSLPIKERKQRTHCGRDDALEDIRAMLDELPDSVWQNPGGRLLHLQPFRPYRHRNAVMEEVAAVATEKYGQPVSHRMVRTCWEWFVQLQASLRKELDQSRRI